MRAYIEFAKKAFLNNMVYRFNHFIGILNTCLQIFIFWCIYKTLYGGATQVDGITFSMVTTNFILSLGLSSAFNLNDFFIKKKLNDGSIVNEFLKPVNFKARILAEDLGTIAFKLIFNFTPALIITALVFEMNAPVNLASTLLFVLSTALVFFVLWNLSFIIQTASFWLVNVWSISTIKNVFVNVLSGAMLPLWFMPKKVVSIIKFTPFDSIYLTPVQIYLGKITGNEIAINFLRQVIWIAILYLIGEIMWRCGQKKLIVQGG